MPSHTHERVWTGAFLQSMTTVYTASIDTVTGRAAVEVSIFLRPDSDNWYYFWRETPGKTYRYRSTGTADQEAARHIAIQKYFEWIGGIEAKRKPREPTIKQLEAEWERWIEGRETTQETKRKQIGRSRLYIVPFFGDRRISTITERDIDAYRLWRLKDSKPPKHATIHQEAGVISLWTLFGAERGFISHRERPIVRVQIPADEEPDSTFFTLEELQKLYRYLRRADPFLFEVCRLAYYLGCRPTELYNLSYDDTWDHIHRSGGLKITTVQVRLRGKGHKRTVVAPAIVRTILRNLRAMDPQSGKIIKDRKDFREALHNALILAGAYQDAEERGHSLGSFRITRANVDLAYHGINRNVLAAYQGHTPEQQSASYNRLFKMLEQQGMYVR